MLTWNGDGSILSATANGTAYWDSRNFQLILIDINVQSIFSIKWFPSRTQAILVAIGGVGIVEPTELWVQSEIFINLVNSIAISRDGAKFVSGSLVGRVTLWDAISHEEVAILQPDQEPSVEGAFYDTIVIDLVFAPDDQAVSAIQGDGQLTTWNITSQQVIFSTLLTDNLISVAVFSPDGTKLAYAELDGTFYIETISNLLIPVATSTSRPH